MKQLLLLGIIILSLLISCNKGNDIDNNEVINNEIIRQMVEDTLASIEDLYALCIYYGDDEVGFYWNSPLEYANNPGGSFDTTLVFPEQDALRIEYSIFFDADINTVPYDYVHRMTIYVPYEIVTGISKTAPNNWYDFWEVMVVYVNEDRHNWVQDEETILLQSSTKSSNTPELPRSRQRDGWDTWD